MLKGAPLFILKRCSKELVNGKIQLMSPERKKEIVVALKNMESSGLRVLGFGFKQLAVSNKDIVNINQKKAENQFGVCRIYGND